MANYNLKKSADNIATNYLKCLFWIIFANHLNHNFIIYYVEVEIKLRGRKLEQVLDTFKYLGVNIHKSGTEDVAVVGRIESTNKLYYALHEEERKNQNKNNITVHNTVFKPVLTYGCRSWNVTNQMKSNIQKSEMKYLTAVKGVTRRYKIRNQQRREDLNVEPILALHREAKDAVV